LGVPTIKSFANESAILLSKIAVDLTHSEVADENVVRGLEEYVSRLYISVNNSFSMDVRQCLRHIFDHFDYLSLTDYPTEMADSPPCVP